MTTRTAPPTIPRWNPNARPRRELQVQAVTRPHRLPPAQRQVYWRSLFSMARPRGTIILSSRTGDFTVGRMKASAECGRVASHFWLCSHSNQGEVVLCNECLLRVADRSFGPSHPATLAHGRKTVPMPPRTARSRAHHATTLPPSLAGTQSRPRGEEQSRMLRSGPPDCPQ